MIISKTKSVRQYWKGCVMESEFFALLSHNQTCPVAMSSTQLWAILDLGQHPALWDSISRFLWAGFLIFFSPLQNHLISHTPHGSASLDYVTILCQPTENGNVFHVHRVYRLEWISFNIIHLWRFLPLLDRDAPIAISFQFNLRFFLIVWPVLFISYVYKTYNWQYKQIFF